MRSSFSIPKKSYLDSFLKEQQTLAYSYQEIGLTQSTDPIPHFDNDHNSILLGQGKSVWLNAKKALDEWQQFPPNWTTTYPKTTPLKKGENVAVLFRILGLWWINSARIVYAFDEPNRYGFAYGTLPGHVEKGEEVFWIERDDTGNIYYHIKAFSTPQFWLVRFAYPFARWNQKRFVRDSRLRMKKLANASNP